ncbi:hypothetical protein RFI_14956 [Reticulomyxa filosa]|uniref:Uncharacterized protein n=1 Tax=Reticulomyxa filosa TaxID=46433 RepID=X6N863_RETFI|nr:hypothetical protein RFI_14956 [Reticulomyxa filosa]|eukprot:ETO22246.1 hypothetical protein RFI_14956 [Reticulomyxa filosa]
MQMKNDDKDNLKRASVHLSSMRLSSDETTEKSKDKQSDNKKPTGAPTLEQSRETPAIVEIAKATETNTLNTTSVDSKIQRTDTIAQIQEMQQSIHQLPQLHGFLKKNRASGLADGKNGGSLSNVHICFGAKKEQYIDNPLDIKERRKFQNSLTLLQLSSVVVDSSDKKNRGNSLLSHLAKNTFFELKTSPKGIFGLMGCNCI